MAIVLTLPETAVTNCCFLHKLLLTTTSIHLFFFKTSKQKMASSPAPSSRSPLAPPPGLRQPFGISNPVLSKVIIVNFEGERDEQQRPIGTGLATFKHGHTYQGSFEDGWMHGAGTFTWVDGTVYTGTFVRNTIEGKGRFDWKDGSYYEGEVQGGIRHGTGIMQVASTKVEIEVLPGFKTPGEETQYTETPGPYYQGEWKNGLRDGQGLLKYVGTESTSQYNGAWSSGMRSGLGELIYPSGNVYTGNWLNDCRDGNGLMKWNTVDETYDGEWKKGKQSGRGTHVWLKGGRAEHGATQRLMCNRYVGDWKNGLRSGNGVFYYSNGSRYVGEFLNNLKSGHGVYTFPDGRVYEGPFVMDRMSFNDGSLEEKVATRGPVKIESSRKGKGKKKSSPKKKKKLSPTGTPRAVPLAGTTRNVHLNVSDLLVGIPPKERSAERRGIEKLVMRWNSGMKQIYAHYSTIPTTTYNNEEQLEMNNPSSPKYKREEIFYLNQGQLWKLCEDANLVTQSLTLTNIARIFSTVKIQFASSIAIARRRREAHANGQDEDLTPTVDDRLYLEPDDPVHELERPILYREFVEGLVRIAAAVYEDDLDKPSLPDKFSALLDGPIKEGSRTKVSAAGGKPSPTKSSKKKNSTEDGSGFGRSSDPVLNALAAMETRTWLQNNNEGLRTIFNKYGHVGFGGKNDITLHAREFAALFKEVGVVVKTNEMKGNTSGGKKQEEEEEKSDDVVDGEEKEVEEEVTYLQGLNLMEVVLLYPKQKFGNKNRNQPEVDDDGDTNEFGSSDTARELFDPNDDATNFEMEMNYNEFIEMVARLAVMYHPVFYGLQCLNDVKLAKEKKETEIMEAAAAEEAAAVAPVEEEEAAVVAEEEETEESEESEEVVVEEVKEEVDLSRLEKECKVFPALVRLCEKFLL